MWAGAQQLRQRTNSLHGQVKFSRNLRPYFEDTVYPRQEQGPWCSWCVTPRRHMAGWIRMAVFSACLPCNSLVTPSDRRSCYWCAQPHRVLHQSCELGLVCIALSHVGWWSCPMCALWLPTPPSPKCQSSTTSVAFVPSKWGSRELGNIMTSCRSAFLPYARYR